MLNTKRKQRWYICVHIHTHTRIYVFKVVNSGCLWLDTCFLFYIHVISKSPCVIFDGRNLTERQKTSLVSVWLGFVLFYSNTCLCVLPGASPISQAERNARWPLPLPSIPGLLTAASIRLPRGTPRNPRQNSLSLPVVRSNCSGG